MRVLLIHQNAYAPSHSAGTRHFEFAKELIAGGHSVCIVASSFFHKTRKETRLGDGENSRYEVIEGVPFLWLRTPAYKTNGFRRLWNMLVFAFRVLFQISFFREFAPDLVIGSSPPLFSAFAAMVVAQRLQKPFVLEVRDLWPETLIEIGGLSRYHPLMIVMGTVEKSLYRNSNLVISTLEHGGNYIKQKYGLRKNVVWVPNGVRLTFKSEPKRYFNSRFIAMYAGAHGAANDLDVIVDAAKKIQNTKHRDVIEIHLIGDGPEKERLMQRKEIEGIFNIQFLESVSKEKIFSVLMNSDCFLMPLKRSALFEWGISPNKLSDYMACARPIIFGVSSSSNPISKSGCGITVPAGDSESFADAICEVADKTESERKLIGDLGRQYVEECHDIAKLSQQLEQALLEVCKDGARQEQVQVKAA